MVRAPLFNRFDQSFSPVCESFSTCFSIIYHPFPISFWRVAHHLHTHIKLVSSWRDNGFITMRLIKDIDEKDTRRMGKGLEDREKECGSLLDKECKQVILLSKEHFKKSPPASYCLLRWVDISPKQCKEIGIDVLVRKPHPSSLEGRSA